ncbi:hypothetical protein CVT24_012273 [Panaeolus cyanescens]|uniref:MINDY deubiquitinase domain-containing protein n=1 Tax=Panaeolus cyanescens TaxID=181874 RepID=A0A409WK36_9AGAR|nr:hypothetical protein CVT24_012273 [Panaeolus cyanescens]
MSHADPTIQSSLEDVWYLKAIKFNDRDVRIITQNFNGPCSFIAVCNILILRGNIEIQPPSRKTVSYEFLSQLVAEYLLTSSPDVDISAALSIMPYTQKGMDLNPLFTSATSFQPAGTHEGAGELKLFSQAGIQLVHGWLVDPNSPEAPVISKVKDYDTAVALIAEADHLTNGQFVVDENALHAFEDQPGGSGSSSTAAGSSSGISGSSRVKSSEDRQKIEDGAAIVVKRFLDQTQSQLTYHGLFHLATSLPPNTPTALFRNSHLSVLYKTASPSSPSATPVASNDSPEPPAASSSSALPPTTGDENVHYSLYTLVTDQVFLQEPSVVWERFDDIDGEVTFVDSNFVKASPAGGDFAGQTAEQALRAAEDAAGINEYGVAYDPNDAALARQLQVEEDRRAQKEQEAYNYMRQQERIRLAEEQEQIQKQQANPPKAQKKKKKGDCIIM